MQFLVYLTLLMVSISTVLLEVHWLASPEPKPKPAVQTTAPAQAPKTESSNARIRTVYPKNLDASGPVESDSQTQTADTRQAGQTTPATNTPVQNPAQTTMALPAQQPEPPASMPQSATSQQPALATQPVPPQQSPVPSAQREVAPQPGIQQSRAETTGAAVREENRTQAADPANPSNRADNSQQQATLGSSRNRCDIQACAGAYRRSFRASDCTYQPFDGGPRRLCEKSPRQRVAREREQPERRRWSRDAETRYLDRPTSGRRFVDEYDDVAADFDDARREPLGFFLFGRRPR